MTNLGCGFNRSTQHSGLFGKMEIANCRPVREKYLRTGAGCDRMRFERTIKKYSTIRVSIGFLVKMDFQRFKISAVVAGLTLLALPAHGETRVCAATNVTVTYQQEEHAELVCSAAQKATALFND